MYFRKTFTLLFLVCSISFSFGQNPNVYIISDVNIVPMTKDVVLYRQNVTVSDGVIVDIRPYDRHGPMVLDTVVYPASGRFLIPGLAEMHAHIPTPDQDGNMDHVHETLFLYLSQGITTIRGMLGHPSHLILRQEVLEKGLLSPRIYTSSPSMNGNSIPDETTAESKVNQYKRDGYDFLKVHPGIKRSVFDKMVAVANELDLPFAGHVPLDVGIEHAIAARYASIDHLDGFIEGLAPQSMRNDGGFFGVLLADTLDTGLIGPLAAAAASQGIAVVPTQTLFTRWLAPGKLEQQMQDPEMAYIPPGTRFAWRQNKERMQSNLDLSNGRYERFLSARESLMRALQEAGALMLLGSDAPQVMNVPGFSLHREMATMADARLSPYEILQAGTINVAKYFGTEDNTGTIETNKVADMVLLDANPLENITNCQKIISVYYRGNIISRAEIDLQLEKIAAKHKEE